MSLHHTVVGESYFRDYMGVKMNREINLNISDYLPGSAASSKENAGTMENLRCLLKNYQMALNEHAILAITNADGIIIHANDLFCKLSQYSREELVGKDHRIVNSGFHPKAFFQELWETIVSGNTWTGTLRNRAKDGSFYWVKTTILPFKDSKGAITSYVSIRTDITEHIKAKEELESIRKLLEEEKEALKAKNSTMSELLNHLDEEKKKVLSSIRANFEISVFPLLNRIMEQNPSVKNHLEIIKKNLEEIADPIIRNAQEINENLTPRELQLCSLIRQGLTVKEIAALILLSPRTIDKHRENIRKKLHITDRKIKLGAYLINNLR